MASAFTIAVYVSLAFVIMVALTFVGGFVAARKNITIASVMPSPAEQLSGAFKSVWNWVWSGFGLFYSSR